MFLVPVCLSLRGQAFGSRLDPGIARSEPPISLGQLLEKAFVEDQVCDRLSKPGILSLKLLETSHSRGWLGCSLRLPIPVKRFH